MKTKLLLFVIFLIPAGLFSQTFNVSYVETSEFPWLKVNLYAKDSDGRYYRNLEKHEFSVIDEGMPVPDSDIILECNDPIPTNVLVVIDKSRTMLEEIDGVVKFDLAKYGANRFVQLYQLGDHAKAGATVFGGNVALISDFTNDQQELKDNLNKSIPVYGSTNFNAAFLSEPHGAIPMLSTQPQSNRNVVLFITDGKHESGEELQESLIASKITEGNYELFGITIRTDNSELFGSIEDICDRVGADHFLAGNETHMDNIMQTIVNKLRGRHFCTLKWKIQKDPCESESNERDARIIFNRHNLSRFRNYDVPVWFNDKAYIESDKDLYNFGNPEPGEPVKQKISITPRNSDAEIYNIRVQPGNYYKITDWGDGSGSRPDFPFTLKKDETRIIEVEFIQKGKREFRSEALVIDAFPCSKNISLNGGLQDLTVVKPLQGEYHSMCDEVAIEWDGIDATDLVDLYYRKEGSQSWTSIASAVGGNTYKWKAPEPGFYKIRATISFYRNHSPVRTWGAAGNQYSTSLDYYKNNVYISGNYDSEFPWKGNEVLQSIGMEDGFVMCLSTTGNPKWIQSFGSPDYDDRINGVVAHDNGQLKIYAAGSLHEGNNYEKHDETIYNKASYAVVYRLNQNGTVEDMGVIGASGLNPDLNMEALKIGASGSYIYIRGIYRGSGTFYSKINQKNFYLEQTADEKPFTAVFSTNMELLEVRQGNDIYTQISFSDKDWDSRYNPYTKFVTDEYTEGGKIGANDLNNRGGKDFFYAVTSASGEYDVDESDLFEIATPRLRFTKSKISFENVIAGGSGTETFIGILENDGEFPITIENYEINGANEEEFELLTSIEGVGLQPGERIDLSLRFTPKAIGSRYGVLSVFGSCSENAAVTLVGDGACGGIAMPEIDFGSEVISNEKSRVIECIYQNAADYPFKVRPIIEPESARQFFRVEFEGYEGAAKPIITVGPYECIKATVYFTPAEEIDYNAVINFNAELPCRNSETILTGKGTYAELLASPYDWGQKRISTENPASVSLQSFSIAGEKVTGIRIINDADGVFEIENNPGEFDVSKNSQLDLNIKFSPKEEKEYDALIEYTVEGRPEPVTAELKGSGGIPKLVIEPVCGPAVIPGDTSLSKVILSNEGGTMDLTVKSVEFAVSDEGYYWVDETAVEYFIIPAGSQIEIPYYAVPDGDTPTENSIIVYADNYDGNYGEEWRLNEAGFDCGVLGLDYPDPVVFGLQLPCSPDTVYVSIENKSTLDEARIFFEDAVLSGDIRGEFELLVQSEITIPPGESYEAGIIFTPLSGDNSNAYLIIPTSTGIDITIELIGEVRLIKLRANSSKISLGPGEKGVFSVYAQLDGLKSGEISSAGFDMIYNPNVFGIVENTFRSAFDEVIWLWNGMDEDASLTGQLNFSGEGLLETPFDTELFSFEIYGLLNDYDSTDIVCKVDYGCFTDKQAISLVITDELCVDEFRHIISSGIEYNFEVGPNPAGDLIQIEYGIGIEANSNIEVYNQLGELVKILDAGKETGKYEILLNSHDYPPGVYLIRFSSGPFSETKSLMIAR